MGEQYALKKGSTHPTLELQIEERVLTSFVHIILRRLLPEIQIQFSFVVLSLGIQTCKSAE
jgi:hypothetical protein